MSTPQQTLEQRLRLVEDKLAIYHLIASHPPAADTGNENYYRNAFAPDGTVDLGGGLPLASVARPVTVNPCSSRKSRLVVLSSMLCAKARFRFKSRAMSIGS